MAADVELLLLPGDLKDRIHVYVDNSFARPKLIALMQDYARANVAHATAAKDAEIEALRERADKFMWQVRDTCARAEKAEARAERLAEAGRRVTAAFRAHGEATPFTREAGRTRHECEAAMLALDAALEQESNDE